MGKCFKLIIQESGLRGFFRGMATPLVLATPVSALAFMGNSWANSNILKQKGFWETLKLPYDYKNKIK